MLTAVLGCLGATLSMLLPWPQVYRCWAARRTTGLSPTACWLGVAMPIGWITYGLLLGDEFQVVTNSVTGGAGAAVLVALLMSRLDLRRGRTLVVTMAGAAGVVTAALVSGLAAALPEFDGSEVAPVLGVLLAGTAVLAAVPQPLSLLRDRNQDLSGLSPLRWRLAAASGATWFSYGLVSGQLPVWLSASAGLLSALVVCTLLVVNKAPAATSAPAPALTPAPAVVSARAAVPVPGVAPATAGALAPAAGPSGSVPARGGVCVGSRGAVRARPAPVARGAGRVAQAAVCGTARPASQIVRDPARVAPGAVRGTARVPRPAPRCGSAPVPVTRPRPDAPTLVIPAHWLDSQTRVPALSARA